MPQFFRAQQAEPKEPIDSKMANQILINNRGHYRMYNFQNSIKSTEAMKRARITMGLSRREELNQQLLKL